MLRSPPLPDSIILPRRWRTSVPAIVLFLAIALAAVLNRREAIPASSDQTQSGDVARYHDREFDVVHVVDGDTIDIGAPDGDRSKTRVRLWGVDTPEVAHHRGETDMYFGPQARDFGTRTLDGRSVHIVLWQQKTRDRYGRLLGYVFLERGGPMFNEMLIDSGLAYADHRFDHPYKQEFKRAEDHARKQRTGLWQSVAIEQMPKWRQRRERTVASQKTSPP